MPRPVFHDEIVERYAAEEILCPHSGGELIFRLGITEDQMSEATLVEAVADEHDAGVHSLVPQIQELLVLKTHRIRVHTAIQHGVAAIEPFLQILLQ